MIDFYDRLHCFFEKKQWISPLLNFFLKHFLEKKNKLKDFSKKQNFFMQTFACSNLKKIIFNDLTAGFYTFRI